MADPSPVTAVADVAGGSMEQHIPALRPAFGRTVPTARKARRKGTLMTQARTEFEGEYEDEYELEDEFESEHFLGGLAKVAGSLLGEGEDEYESEYEYEAEDELEGEFEDEFETRLQSEFEDEYEDEYEYEDEVEGEDEYEDEAFLGGLGKIAGALLGEGEGEYEDEAEAEAEYFFKKVGGFLRRHKGLLKKIAKTAAPLIATAVGGPAAGMVARAVTSQLEGEFEDELEAELEDMATAPVSPQAALGEYLAARAATAQTEAEAEAFIGSAITVTLSNRDRRELEEILPQLLRGATVLTRILRRYPQTRQAVRLVPGIVDSTSRTIAGQRAAGRVIRPADVGAVLGGSTRRVLGDPRWQSAVARRHARGLAHMRRRRHQQMLRQGAARGRRGPVMTAPRRRPVGTATLRRRPVHTHRVGPRARVGRPSPGFVRVVTPVRVPPRAGLPGRTIRVVSDVKVPRGAVPAGRPASVAGRRR
jgi:hypothetical protein